MIVLEAKLGEYVIMARRKGYEWYIGAMTNWTEREFEIDLSFLGDRRFEMTEFRDGPNAHRNAQDFVKEAKLVDKNETVSIKLAPGGGYAAILSVVRY
jgi:alpha-glucosidase